MGYQALVHEQEDDVAVAVEDLSVGTEAKVHCLQGGEDRIVTLVEDIPLGHKFALRDIGKGEKVVKYNAPIGKAVEAIAKGAHVHVHNLKSLRW